MICPLAYRAHEIWESCQETKCSWWDSANGCCSIKAIVIELIKTQGD